MTSKSRSMTMAMLSAAAVTAQFVGGKATRDALFLTSFDITALPTMLIATSVCSILFVGAHGRWSRTIAPATLVPASFVASAVLFLGEWLFRSEASSATAVIVYLHISGAGPLLASGFWLIASERFDPRTAKRRFGQIAGAGTLGGLFGAMLSERVAAVWGGPSMLLFLGALQLLTAWLVWRLASDAEPMVTPASSDAVPGASTLPLRSGLRVIAEAPHLRHLATLVLLGTTSAALLDYVFKAKAVETLGTGDSLLRFFAMYYAATSLISFILQILASRAVLERFGVALTTSTPSIALLAGSIVGLVAPGFGSLIVARGGESVFRASWFRAGYELFYTPIPVADKRAAKSVIDVAFDRLGDAAGGGLVRLAVLFVPAARSSAIVSLAMASSVGAIIAASQLNRWYVRTLENSLVDRSGGIDLSDTQDGSTAIVLRDLRSRNAGRQRAHPAPVDPVLQDIRALRSGRRDAVIDVLSRPEGLSASLVPHAIALLASEPVADYAVFALRKVAEERVGELSDALLDPGHEYAVRRRLARVFSICVSQRAVDALILALDDMRFDVRFQAARSLAAILDRNSLIRIDRERVHEVVLREVAVGRPVLESRHLLDGFVGGSPLDAFVRDRAGQSLAHVFTLLSLVLPREPLQIAFRSLHSDDKHLRGTALEYLEGVLPAPIRQGLWPFLVYRRVSNPAPRHDDIMANLLRSSQSVTLKSIAGGWAQLHAGELAS
jgi:AAA family ATP:ADP antiporter